MHGGEYTPAVESRQHARPPLDPEVCGVAGIERRPDVPSGPRLRGRRSEPVESERRQGVEGMNRTELAEALSRSTGLSRSDATIAVQGLFDPRSGVISRALRRRRTVRITGFGSFVPRRRDARIGRDPRTGDPIRIPAGTAITFRAGKPLRETLG